MISSIGPRKFVKPYFTWSVSYVFARHISLRLARRRAISPPKIRVCRNHHFCRWKLTRNVETRAPASLACPQICPRCCYFGFLQFYSNFIPHFEVRSLPLRDIMTREYTEPVGDLWTQEANSTFEDLKKLVLSDPCLCRIDHSKLTVLRTDFSCLEFGYVVCRPGDDECSLEITMQYMSGNGFGFMTKSGNQGTLHPVAFGLQRTQGNEKSLHSYLGEGFAGDWAINKV